MLDQLRREQEEELEKVQHHLQAAESAMRELENNIKLLQQSNNSLTEVETSHSKSFRLCKIYFILPNNNLKSITSILN